MSNTVKQLGFIPTNRGEFDTTGQTRYYKDNVVQYRNGSYICSPVGYSSSNPTAYTTDAPYQDGDTQLNANWKLMASVGLVDEEPTAGSDNLIKSGGVFNINAPETNFKDVLGLRNSVGLYGNLDNTYVNNQNVSTSLGRFFVITLSGQASLTYKASSALRIAFVKTFNFSIIGRNYYDFCDGTGIIQPASSSTTYTITIPSDAKYLVVARKGSTGNDIIPAIFELDGVDIIESLGKQIDDIKETVNDELLPKSSNIIPKLFLLDDATNLHNQFIGIETNFLFDELYLKQFINSTTLHVITIKAVIDSVEKDFSILYDNTTQGVFTGIHIYTGTRPTTDPGLYIRVTVNFDGIAYNIGTVNYKINKALVKQFGYCAEQIEKLNILTTSQQIAIQENTEKVKKISNTFSVNTVTLDWPLDKVIYPDGRLVNNSNTKCTDYVKVNPSDVVILKATTGETQYPVCMGYDENKQNPIVLLDGGDHNDYYNLITIPDGVEYIACAGRANETHEAYIETYHLKELSDPIGTIVIGKEDSSIMWVSVKMSETDYIRYKFVHYNNVFSEIEYIDGDGNTQVATNVISCSVWNNLEVYKNTSYIAQGNTNFINRPTNGSYSGDGHGLEVALYEKIFLDGTEVDFDNLTEPIKGRQFRLLSKANIYKHGSGAGEVGTNVPLLDTSGNPIVSTIHNMDVIIENGEMTVDNYLVMVEDNISFQDCYGAMLECKYTDFDTVFANNSDMSINSQSEGVFTNVGSTISLPGTYQHCDKVIMKGSRFTITQDMINLEPTDCKAGVHFEPYSNRLKCYFQPVPTSVRSGGQIARVFNTGDIIHVKCHRRIEC